MSKLGTLKELIGRLHVPPILIFVSEAEIKNPEHLKACNIPGYTLHSSKDPSKSASRLGCYSWDKFPLTRKEIEGQNDLEVIIMESQERKERYLGFYNPFKITLPRKDYNDLLFKTIQNASTTPYECLFGGDMNIDLTKQTSLSTSLENLLLDSGLVQLVQQTTRHRHVQLKNGNKRNEASLIDHVYSTSTIYEIEQLYSDMSDHEIIIAKKEVDYSIKCKRKLLIRDWRNYSDKKLLKALNKHQPAGLSSVNFSETLDIILDVVAPIRVIKINPEAKNQVVHPKLEKKKKRRDQLYRQFRVSRDKELLEEIRELSKEIKKMVKTSRKNSIQANLSTTPRKFWQTVNGMLGKRSSSDIMILKDGVKITDDEALAMTFSDFFKNKVDVLSRLDIHPLRMVALQPNPKCPVNFTLGLLNEILKELKPKKCNGTDSIPFVLARDVVRLFPEIALRVFNAAARYGMPDQWRIARVIPLHKKNSKHDVTNFRPISNLNALSKIYEKLLLRRLEEETYGLEGDSQHGFRKRHSTTTALIEIQSFIAQCLDKNLFVIAYSIDLRAAFDVLRPDIFDEIIGPHLSDGLRYSIMDFLSKRKFSVAVGRSSSPVDTLEVGCVQGSTLGPRLFTLYMKGINELLGADKYISYADDSYVLIAEASLDAARSRLQAISKKHIEELRRRSMIVNEDKTEIVVFCKKGLEIHDFTIGSVQVTSKKSMKALGIIIDCNLKWEEQVSNVIKNSSWKLTVLKKLRPKFTQKQFLQILTSQHFSKMLFASPVWLTSCISVRLWSQINKAHYQAIRTAVNDFKRRINREKLDILSSRAAPRQWSKYSIASLVIKILRDRSPSGLHDLLKETYYEERRHVGIGKFFDNSKGKIGKQKFGNNLQYMSAIRSPWNGQNWSDDKIRVELKKTFFSYISII